MTPERWRRITEIFHGARARDAAARGAFLDEACAGDTTLRAEVDGLLTAHLDAGRFGETPVSAFTDERPRLEPGATLGPYRIEALIGAGGMGEVYRAYDARLERDVAVKVLSAATFSDRDARQRLLREARSAAALNHPHVCTIHEVGEADGQAYIVMELVEGQPLDRVIPPGGLPVDQVLRYGLQMADAVAHAHERGIVHRDLKTANAVLTPQSRVKVLDFGLAKRLQGAALLEATAEVGPSLTEAGTLVGTLAYMAPEQLRGEPADARSDVWALGVVLYEMTAGARPFPGRTGFEVSSAILNEPPAPLADKVPLELRTIVNRCLEKPPEGRYQRAGDVYAALDAVQPVAQPRAAGSRRRVGLITAAILVALVAVASIPAYRWQTQKWRANALREIEGRIDVARYGDAYQLARELERRLPNDGEVQQAILRTTSPSNVLTDPPGAAVYFKDYADSDRPWRLFGTSPIEKTRVPVGALRWKVTKAGFDPVEGRFSWGAARTVRLHATGTGVPGMVYVPAARVEVPVPADLGGYWIGTYEVSNREFKDFVDRGGYRDKQYWKHPFVKDGQSLSWEQATALFHDKTGRPAPATWEVGAYPQGQGDHPVGGISWYEAAAFAEFAGRSLPTVAHWQRAVGPNNLRDDVTVANFSGRGSEPVARLRDLGPFGTYGLAGNVREWCSNPIMERRYSLGGAWSDPPYQSTRYDALPPFDRREGNGFRLVKYDEPPDGSILGELRVPLGRIQIHPPVDDAVFQAYRSFYSYNRTPLDARVERVEETEHWRKETVSFAAAYGKERLAARLLLPTNAAPPFQTVIWFPGSYALDRRSSEPMAVPFYFDFLIRSGRAVVYPIYQGMYERQLATRVRPGDSVAYRDAVVQWSKDLGRTIDYLETRNDIAAKDLAFYGFSMVSQAVPLPAIEPRLKVLIFLSCGIIRPKYLGEVDPINFAPHIKAPLLMLGGKYDYLTAVEDSQRPLFNLIGTPAADKRLKVFNSGHVPERIELVPEILDWLDRYLGPVKMK